MSFSVVDSPFVLTAADAKERERVCNLTTVAILVTKGGRNVSGPAADCEANRLAICASLFSEKEVLLPRSVQIGEPTAPFSIVTCVVPGAVLDGALAAHPLSPGVGRVADAMLAARTGPTRAPGAPTPAALPPLAARGRPCLTLTRLLRIPWQPPRSVPSSATS